MARPSRSPRGIADLTPRFVRGAETALTVIIRATRLPNSTEQTVLDADATTAVDVRLVSVLHPIHTVRFIPNVVVARIRRWAPVGDPGDIQPRNCSCILARFSCPSIPPAPPFDTT